MISLATNVNPTKVEGSEKFMPFLAQMLHYLHELDPPTPKMLLVEVKILEFLEDLVQMARARPKTQATGGLCLKASYFLWCVGECMVKGLQNYSKQTEQFKMEDCLFFRKNSLGHLWQLSSKPATAEKRLSADCVTMKLDQKKNCWKSVCIHHQENSEEYLCWGPCGSSVIPPHTIQMTSDWKTLFSALEKLP